LRRQHRVFSRGAPEVLHENAAGAGACVYCMCGEGGDGVVVFNTASTEAPAENIATGLAPGTVLRGVFAIDGDAQDIVAGDGGRVTLRLPPRSGMVWIAGVRGEVPHPVAAPSIDVFSVGERKRPAVVSAEATATAAEAPAVIHADAGVQRLSGTAAAGRELRIVVDGDLASAQRVVADADGRWEACIDTASMIDPAVEHTVVAFDEAASAASQRRSFRVAREWALLADIDDPSGDDRGPAGQYDYPADPGWDAHQADIEHVRAYGAGGALKIEVRMRAVSALWNPPNGFDHVAFTLFVQLPEGEGGARVMPLQHAQLPGGMRWDYRLRANGWTTALFSSAGASDAQEGTPATPAGTVHVDADARTLAFTLPAASLGKPRSLAGAKLYITTWDYDGGYRPLQPEAGAHAFGGGQPGDALVMDDTAVITLALQEAKR
jgi:carbohydrate-binding DOMON domain-containing protein